VAAVLGSGNIRQYVPTEQREGTAMPNGRSRDGSDPDNKHLIAFLLPGLRGFVLRVSGHKRNQRQLARRSSHLGVLQPMAV
jgi:hypothetical protein